MDKIPSFKAFDECTEAFALWWTGVKGTSPSRHARFTVAAEFATAPFSASKDLNQMTDMLSEHAQALGWCAEWLPDSQDFLHQAMALSSEVINSGPERLSWNDVKLRVQGKCHAFQRVVDAVERLSATLNHRMDALRTVVSLEKERWKNEMGPGQ